ncbi:MAG: FtsX-like permease family protein [Victivallaceae bacterium]|nr:FtsX-like permease family protein [Victivallaceae bacterium]
MVSVLDRKLRRDLSNSKWTLLAIAAIIMVGVSCLAGMLGVFYNLEQAKSTYLSRCRMADFWVTVKKAPVQAINDLTGIPGVSEIRSRISFPVIVALDGVDKPINGKVISMPVKPAPVINNLVLRQGSYFSEKRRNEVIVSEKFARARKLFPGSQLKLVLNGQLRPMYVVGVAISSEFMYIAPPGSIMPDNTDYGIFWARRDFLEDAYGFQGAGNDIAGLLTPAARKRPDAVLRAVSDQLRDYGVFAVTPLADQESYLTISAELEGLRMQAVILPLIFLGVAAMVLNIVMMRTAEQQRVVIGTLKALGVGNEAIMAHFLKFGLTVGLTGGITGVLLGYALAWSMTDLYRLYFSFPRLENHFYPSVGLLSLALAAACALLGTARGVKAILRLSPAEAMRPSPPAVVGKIWLEYLAWWNKLDFRRQMVWRTLFRNKLRTAIGIVSAALGSAILVLALGLADSFNYMLAFQFDKVLLADYVLGFRNPVSNAALDETRRLPGVCYAEPQLALACELRHGHFRKRAVVTGLPLASVLNVPRDAAGRKQHIPPVGALVTSRMAEHLHVKPGDSFIMTPIRGVRTPRRIQVANIVESTFGMGVYLSYQYLNRLLDEDGVLTSVLLKTGRTAAERTAFFRQVRAYPQLSAASSTATQKIKLKQEFVEKMKVITAVMIVFAAVIFFGSILNAAMVAFSERNREIATFRIIGYRPLEIGEIFFREIALINFTGTLLGLPLGYVLLSGMARISRNDMYSMPCRITLTSWIEAVALGALFILAAYWIIQSVINRMKWAEALQMRE